MTLVDPMSAMESHAFLRFADAAIAHALGPGPEGSTDDLEHDLRAARADLEVAVGEGSSFSALCANARATGPSLELLALLVACESDIARGTRVAPLSGATRPGRLTLGAAARLLGGMAPCVTATGPASPLIRGALIEIVSTGPWATAEIALAPAVLWALGGDQSTDRDLPIGTWMLEGHPAGERDDRVVFVRGADRVRRRALAARRCGAEAFLVVPVPDSEAGWAAVVREATITGTGVILELTDDLPATGRRWIELATHLAWAVTSPDDLPLQGLPDRARTELTAGDDVVSEEEWLAAFGPDVPRSHRLTAHQLEQVRSTLPAVGGDLDLAVQRLLAGPLGRLARRVRPRKDWADLVLNEDKLDQLRTIVARYRHAGRVYDDWRLSTSSGRGIVSLFTGPSGTGKTLAAEVIAHDLDLDLYRIDLSAVVSKYIGETEQNLEKLFAAASAGNAVLFFDEADSLFGKRSEVKEGRDRYANLEVSYLLQRLESYDGVVVLATNLPKNIDDAFLRRIHEIVDFTTPGPEERAAIWRRHLDDGQVPLGDLDVDLLVERFEITGGLIRNVVVSAAFRAADDDRPLSMTHVLSALAAEYRKLGRLMKPEDFDVRS